MFCTKCGTQNPEGAGFCIKCGAKLVTEEPAPAQPIAPEPPRPVQQPAQPAQPQQRAPSGQPTPTYPQPAMSPASQKKKMPKWPFIVGGAVVVVLALILVVIFGDVGKPKYNYEATLRAYTPFSDSQDLPYTFGEVMDKYLENAAWDVEEKEDGQAIVTVSGTLKGFGEKAEFNYTLTPDPEDSDVMKFKDDGVTVNSEKSSWDGANDWFLIALYTAYDNGDEELADLSGLLVALGIHEPKLMETYTNDDAGISFKYPSAWQEPSSDAKEALSNFEEVFGNPVFTLADEEEYLSEFNSIMAIFKAPVPATQEDVELLLGDDDELMEILGFDGMGAETSVTQVGGVPGRVISVSTEDEMCIRIYMYIVGDEEYTILFLRGGKESAQLEDCFDAVMDTYTITVPEPTPTPEPTPSPTLTPAPTPVPKTDLDDITFRGESLVVWCNRDAAIAYDQFGMPDRTYTEGQGSSWYDEGVVFYYSPETMLNTSVTVFSPSVVQFNGTPMAETRDGILDMLGTPDNSDGNFLYYYYDEIMLVVETSGSGLVLQINILPY